MYTFVAVLMPRGALAIGQVSAAPSNNFNFPYATVLSVLRWRGMSKALLLEGQATVLVVDDEPLVRILTVQVLEEAGFQVEEAGNSEEALSRLNGHQIAALVTDIHMPGSLDGRGLAWRVHQLFPAVVTVIISGVATPGADELPPKARFLAKPFDPKRLIRELSAALPEA